MALCRPFLVALDVLAANARAPDHRLKRHVRSLGDLNRVDHRTIAEGSAFSDYEVPVHLSDSHSVKHLVCLIVKGLKIGH